MTVKQLKKYITMTGGATIDAVTGNIALLHAGYMVSLAGYEKKTTLSKLNYSVIKHYLKLAKNNGAYLGLWLDGGALYIDISVCIGDLHEALMTASANKQLAIYDLKNAVSIYLK